MGDFDPNQLNRIESDTKAILEYQGEDKEKLLKQIRWLKKQDAGVLANQVDELRKGWFAPK